MVKLGFLGGLKTTFTLAFVATMAALSAPVLTVYAADVPSIANLPQVHKCKTTIYMSSRWNKNNAITYSHDSLGYRKLICKTGRQAFIFVQHPAQKFLFTLVDFSNQPLTNSSSNLCGIVDNYCDE